MAGIKISDLPPNSLPLIGDEQLELENADGNSTRATVQDIASAASGLDATFVTISANAALPNERVLTAGTNVSLVDSGPNGTVTINVAGGGDVLKVGTPVDNQIGVWTGDGTIEGDPDLTWDGARFNIAGLGSPGNLLLSFGDGDTGFYQLADDILNMAFAGVGAWSFRSSVILSFNGPQIFNELPSATNPVFCPHFAESDTGIGWLTDQVVLIGGGVSQARSTAPASGGFEANNLSTGAGFERVLTVSDLGGFGDVFKVGTPVDNQIGVWTGDGTIEGDPNFEWDGVTNTLSLVGSPVNIEGSNLYRFDGGILLDGGSVTTFNFASLFGGIQDHGIVIGPSGINFLHNLSGTPFVLTGDYTRFEVDRPIRVTNDINVDWMDQSHDGTDYNFDAFQTADVNFTGLSGRIMQDAETLAFVSEIVSPDPLLLSSGGAGVPTYSFAADSDTGVYNPVLDSLGLTAGGVLGFSITESGSHVVQTNEEHVGLTASVTQTQAGGLALLSSYNEIATVGTTGDALTAFAVAVGERLVVINNGANDLQLFPAVGDNLGAGVDTAITIAAGELGIFIGRDLTNWDTLYNAAPSPGAGNVVDGTVDGQVVIWDIGNNQYEPVASSSILINPATPPTSPLGRISGGGSSTTDVRKAFIHNNIGASVGTVWSTDRNGGTPAGFYGRSSFNFSPEHDWGYWESPGSQTGVPIFRMTDDLEFIFNLSSFYDERAAALASVAARGQVWVRNDVPNVLVYTDDTGADFVLNAIAPGGGLPVGTVGNAALKWDGISAWVEETQIRMPGGATGLQVFDGGGSDNVSIGHDGTNGLVNTVGSAEVIFGLTSGPTTGWRFQQRIRVPDGLSTAPTMTFFGGGVSDGFFRSALGIGVSVGAVEHFRVSNATVQCFADDFRLNPNLGADSVRMIVNGPSNLNDFEIELTSLIDFHVSGTGAERFVLEELNLAMVEKSAAPGDVAGVGQFWVRDDVPNIPMYTDDAGTDKKLGLVNDAVQARRTTTLTLTAAFVDVTLDATDVETDAAIIEHDVITDRITIGETGTYEIFYQFNVATVTATNSLIDADGRVRLNDAGTGIPGSLATTNCKRQHGNDIASHLSVKFIVDLTAADFITLQVQKTDLAGAEAFFIDETTLQVTRLL